MIARQVLALREAAGARLPLVLMNSFYTREDSLALLERYADLAADVPFDFVQHKEPKLLADGLEPGGVAADPSLEWCPPGHGDIYTALLTSGMLARAARARLPLRVHLELGQPRRRARPADPRLDRRRGAAVRVEVADRTAADRKGGHIARLKETGGLILRETAQTPDEDMDAFKDVERHRYFHVNNLWVDLRALAALLRERDGVLGLPMIVNEKTVDPSDASSPAVYQLETAMGAAIGVFEGARALRVPRSRFVPVKKTSDLLVLRSDAYVLGDGARIELAAGRDARAARGARRRALQAAARLRRALPGRPAVAARGGAAGGAGDVTFGRDVACAATSRSRARGGSRTARCSHG